MSASPRTSAASPDDAVSEAWALAFRTMAPDAPPLRFEIVRANGRASAAPSWRAARDAAMLLAATGGAAAAGVSPVTARALCGEDVLREQRFG